MGFLLWSPHETKFRATAISSNQLSFFSIFDIDEDEITQIVDSPKEHLNDAYTSGLNFKSDESNISEINYDSERRENHLYEKSKLLKNQILHTINFAAETDYLYSVEEYNPDLGGLVIEWTLRMCMLFFYPLWKSLWKSLKN